jgi:ATP-dependent exoDNAse (exonuclease V) beta subunit
MPIATIIALVTTYGPDVLPVIQQIAAWLEGGKTAVTAADIAVLVSYGKKTSSDYLSAAGGPPAQRAT